MTRLQKLLAAAGLGSRRTVEQWIRDGRVTIGGRIAQLGDRASAQDEVCLDGRKLELNPAQLSSRELLLYHKPVGEVTTRSDPQGRPTVFERLPEPRSGRWITVGRLDVNTSGLLLFTTDGELAHRLMHPSSEIEREYLVRVRGRPQPGIVRQLLAGVDLEDGTARFDRITQEIGEGEASEGINTTFRVVLHEGRNREVRRLWQAVGLDVSRLLRVRYGPVELPRDLRPGAARVADASVTERLVAAAQGLGPMARDAVSVAAAQSTERSISPAGAMGREPRTAEGPWEAAERRRLGAGRESAAGSWSAAGRGSAAGGGQAPNRGSAARRSQRPNRGPHRGGKPGNGR